MKVFCVYSSESPHWGDSHEHTQYTIFNIKKENHTKLSQICSQGIFAWGLKNGFETAVVNEPSVFEPLKFYCNMHIYYSKSTRGGRVVRRCWVNFQCRGVLLIWIIVGEGPTVLAVGGGGVVWTLPVPYLSPSLWQTARYRLKYCRKGPLSPKQPTN